MLDRRGRPGFGAAVAAEWSRSTTLRQARPAPLVCALAGAAVAALFLLTAETTTGTPVSRMSASDVVTTSMLGVDAATFVVIVLIASLVAGEQSTGLNRIVLLAVPRRGRRLAASALVVAVGGLLCGLAAGLSAFGAGQLVSALFDGATTSFTAEGVARTVLGSTVMIPFYGAVTLACTTVARSLPGGVAGTLGLFVLPTLLGWIPGDSLDGVLRYLPGEVVHAVAGFGAEANTLHPMAALAVLTAWAVTLVAVAHLWTRRRSW